MANDLNKFSAGPIEKGLDNYDSEIAADLTLETGSANITTGIRRGSHPRPGMAPIPGHSSKDIPGIFNSLSLRGLRASEETGNEENVFVSRNKFLGIQPLSILDYTNLSQKGNMFVWLLGDNGGSAEYLNAVANCTFDSASTPDVFAYNFDLAYGFANNLWAQAESDGGANPYVYWLSPLFKRMNVPSSLTQPTLDYLKSRFEIGADVYHASSAVLAVSGNKWQQQWYMGGTVTTGTATTTASASYLGFQRSSRQIATGISPSWNLGDYKKNNRSLTFWNLSSGWQLLQKFLYPDYPVDSTTFVPAFNQDYTVGNVSVSGNGTAIAPARGGAYTPANSTFVLFNDPEGFCDSSYRMVLVAAQKPLAYVVQDWERDFKGRNIQIAELTDRLHKPLSKKTAAFPTAGSNYSEDGVQVNSCFSTWPEFVSGTPLPLESSLSKTTLTQHVALGGANTGVLRSNTVYEFAFSVFDKQFGTETNVGLPVKVQTGAEDFVRISLFRDSKNGSSQWLQFAQAGSLGVILDTAYWKVLSSDSVQTFEPQLNNYLELRFYYRPLGANEWLPALFIDSAKFFYYPDFQVLWACEGNVAGLPGGQPGGFNDYSFLPEGKYDCVLNYRSRAFWFTKDQLAFSLRNNAFAYPLRNTAPAPTGGFKGGIVHTYRGQSEQEGRLIIFGEKETYIGKFTGDQQIMPVVVSPDTIAEFPLDGSDFDIQAWTSFTAFSHRAAVVADGDLYFWGPQGIIYDDGVGNPQKISQKIEPDIFDLYDQSLTAEIHCVYDAKTKNIIWFYPPADDNTVTHALHYNIETDEYHPAEYDCKIDWAQTLQTNNPTVSQKTNGLRTICAVREDSAATIQRGVFLDSMNRSGDYAPEKELLVKAVTAGANARQKILTLDSGVDMTNFATMATGDYIAIQQMTKYSGETADDMICKLVAKDSIARTLTINLPDGGVLPVVSANDQRKFFPIWHAAKSGQGLNGIPWTWRTNYWLPSGVNYFHFWQFIYMAFKYVTWKKIDPTTFNFAYRSMSGGDFISDTVEFSDNSDANFQLYHALRNGHMNNQGQALKMKLSGVHIGEEWVLQYLEAHTSEDSGNVLKVYQG